LIRLFQPSDEAEVRRIAMETAWYGQSLRPWMDDVLFVSEALVGYYLRHQQPWLWVLEEQSRVVGYLTGCPDTADQHRQWRRDTLPRMARLFMHAHRWRHRCYWHMLGHTLRAAPAFTRLRKDLDDFPAHLHCNLDASARGQGHAAELVQAFMDRLQTQNIPGVFITTSSDAGKRFFAKLGFHKLRGVSLPKLFAPGTVDEWLMTRRL
jgi:RimJ/RimL family protein N-acetyltransferase